MKVLFVALFLTAVAFACDDVASGPYTCTFGNSEAAEVFLDLNQREITVDYPDNSCNYDATAFQHDEDIIVTNVKCRDPLACTKAGFDCLPYTIENIVYTDEEDCTSFDANNEETDETIFCEAQFRRPESSPAANIIPVVSMIAVALLALA
uniref:Uncharacterized protein n=1 Tax=Vannella robusta TaxID=1487602 RepID=A0A7S4HPA4_9EUKA